MRTNQYATGIRTAVIPPAEGFLAAELLSKTFPELGRGSILAIGQLYQPLEAFLKLVAAVAIATRVEVEGEPLDPRAAVTACSQLVAAGGLHDAGVHCLNS